MHASGPTAPHGGAGRVFHGVTVRTVLPTVSVPLP